VGQGVKRKKDDLRDGSESRLVMGFWYGKKKAGRVRVTKPNFKKLRKVSRNKETSPYSWQRVMWGVQRGKEM